MRQIDFVWVPQDVPSFTNYGRVRSEEGEELSEIFQADKGWGFFRPSDGCIAWASAKKPDTSAPPAPVQAAPAPSPSVPAVLPVEPSAPEAPAPVIPAPSAVSKKGKASRVEEPGGEARVTAV